MGTTNYESTFIQVAEDCPVEAAEAPLVGPREKSVASLQYELLADRPYEMTSDDLLFQIHAIRNEIPESEQSVAREAFFEKPQACLRSSPLGKRYGWGFHFDSEGRVALVPKGSERYEECSGAPDIRQLKAMRSKRKG